MVGIFCLLGKWKSLRVGKVSRFLDPLLRPAPTYGRQMDEAEEIFRRVVFVVYWLRVRV